MSMIFKGMGLRVEQAGDSIKVISCFIKESSEDPSMRKEGVQDLTARLTDNQKSALLAIFNAAKDIVKSDNSLQ